MKYETVNINDEINGVLQRVANNSGKEHLLGVTQLTKATPDDVVSNFMSEMSFLRMYEVGSDGVVSESDFQLEQIGDKGQNWLLGDRVAVCHDTFQNMYFVIA